MFVFAPFPYFFVGTFIEAETASAMESHLGLRFPYFFVGTFIEALASGTVELADGKISLLFRRDFH